MYVCMHVCMHVCMYVCLYLHDVHDGIGALVTAPRNDLNNLCQPNKRRTKDDEVRQPLNGKWRVRSDVDEVVMSFGEGVAIVLMKLLCHLDRALQ